VRVRDIDGADGLTAVITGQRSRLPDRVWVESARRGRRIDRRQLSDIAARWREAGVAGRRMGLVADDPVSFAVLFVSLIGAGATVVPLDADAPAEANRALLRAAGVDCVVTTADASPTGRERLLRVSPATLLPEAAGGSPRDAGEGGCLLFSSGSTGPRKAIRLGERQLLHVAAAVARAHELGPADRGYNPLPLFHVNAEVVALLATLLSGGTAVLDRKFHRTGFWPLMAERRVTWINAVPAIVAVLAQDPPGATAPPSLRFVRSASAPLPASVLERFEDRYGVPVIESYGMTEAASQITVNPLHARRAGSAGRPAGVELEVVDEHGLPRPAGELGRVRIRGLGVIRGYEADAGEERFDSAGWLDTGDVGSVDDEGYLWLAGRDGDVINRSGEKILPREVEDVLRAHRAVRDAVVVGRADPVLGQIPVAYVIPAETATDDQVAGLVAELVERSAAALPRTHRPAEIHLVDRLPLGPTGKTVRRLVAARDAALATAGAGGHGGDGR
jgi:acyl-CoA synthetase (AMP-forming)/AMP-acid ligase II